MLIYTQLQDQIYLVISFGVAIIIIAAYSPLFKGLRMRNNYYRPGATSTLSYYMTCHAESWLILRDTTSDNCEFGGYSSSEVAS